MVSAFSVPKASRSTCLLTQVKSIQKIPAPDNTSTDGLK